MLLTAKYFRLTVGLIKVGGFEAMKEKYLLASPNITGRMQPIDPGIAEKKCILDGQW